MVGEPGSQEEPPGQLERQDSGRLGEGGFRGQPEDPGLGPICVLFGVYSPSPCHSEAG